MKRLQKTAVLLTAVILAGAFSSEDIKVEATSSTWQQIQKEQEEKNNGLLHGDSDHLQNQLNEENDNLENLKGEQNSLKGQLNNLNGQLTEVSNNLSDLEQQIADKEQEIADTQASLEEAKATEAWQYECMVIRVRDMYERNETSYINALLNAQSFDKLLNAADFFERIAAYDQKKLQEFEENRKLIEEEEARLQAEKTELDSLKMAAEAEKSKVSGLISQTSNSIAEYAGDISEAEQRALAYEQEIKQKEENLETLRKKLAEEIAMSQKAANATWRDISDISFEEGDRYLLANLIYCEAGGEPYDGQLAVASVVINRVRSSVYPNTVVGVIYQNKQFSPVASGRLELALATNKATSRCYQAADEAMSGVTNVGNCVYFRTPVEGLTGINIGGHVFY